MVIEYLTEPNCIFLYQIDRIESSPYWQCHTTKFHNCNHKNVHCCDYVINICKWNCKILYRCTENHSPCQLYARGEMSSIAANRHWHCTTGLCHPNKSICNRLALITGALLVMVWWVQRNPSFKGAFKNYVDHFCPYFDHLPTSSWHFYLIGLLSKVDIWRTTYHPPLVNIVFVCPLKNNWFLRIHQFHVASTSKKLFAC